ncbi:MAG: AraC family transcriptional regulator [Bacteroidales bacterium]|nr:AraC family transcriptional regulator [Bacteroidales bacterium]
MSLFSKIYKEPFPKYDIPVDYVMDDNVSGSILELYKMFPCKIKAGVFAICLSGGAKVTLNLSEYIVKENDFITVIPGSFLQIHEIYENTSLAFIGFSSNFINTINFWKNITLNLAEVINNPILHLPREIAIFYRDSISLIMKAEEAPIKLLNSNIMASIMEVFYKIHAIIYKTSNVQIAEKGPRELEVLREFIRLAFENYPQEHKATFYANEIGLTLSHFCATIKKATGKTAQDIIRQLIIMDAKAQLKSSDARINKIAKSLGFTPTAFNRYFLEYVKMTPQEYRNS